MPSSIKIIPGCGILIEQMSLTDSLEGDPLFRQVNTVKY